MNWWCHYHFQFVKITCIKKKGYKGVNAICVICTCLCKGTPNPFPFFPTSPSLSVHSGTLLEFLESCLEFPEPPETVRSLRNPRRPSGVSELHPIPFGLASPHFEAHHCTVPSHADSVYVFSCIPNKVSSEYSLWIIPC